MDATYVWHADHSNGGDSATAARQCGPRGRRRQRVARALEHSRRHGHGGYLRQFARLFEGTDSRGYVIRLLDEAHYADILEARAVGFVQLLGQHAEIRGQLSESPLWRRGHETKRLGLRLPAESRSQLFVGAAVGRHVQRVCERHACLWDERRSDRSQLKEKYRRAEKSGLSGGRRDLPRRDQRVLEVARDHHGRDETDSNDCLPLALRGICRERRFVHQFRALAALEEYGLANPRRCPAGPGDRGPNFLEDPRTLQKRRREVPRSDLAPFFEVPGPTEPTPGRGIEGNQWQGARRSRGSRDEAANQGRPAASRLHVAER